MKKYLLTLLLCLSSLTSLTEAQQTSQCMDMTTIEHDARIVGSGIMRRCGVGVTIFGVTVGILGDECPQYQLFYPAHSCCGRGSVGSRCVQGDRLTVARKACSCSTESVIWIPVPGLDCECAPDGDQGHVRDWDTAECDDDSNTPEARTAGAPRE